MSVSATSAGASADVLYTVPSKYVAHLTFLLASNSGTDTKKLYVQRKLGGTSTYETIINGLKVLGNNTVTILDGSTLCLNGTDDIRIYKEAGSTFDVTMSATEYYHPQGL